MWYLKLIPETFIHALLIVGIIGMILSFVVRFIPVVTAYRTSIKIISVVVTILAIFLEGALLEQHAWEKQVKELEIKLAKKEAESAKENVRIVTKVITKKQIVKEKAQTVVKYIDREVVKYDKSCTIPEVVIKAHNAAAKNEIILTNESELSTETHNNLANPKTKLPKK